MILKFQNLIEANLSQFKDLGPTFCALPWMHLSSMPNGVAKMCCISRNDLHDGKGKILSFETTPIKDIWNSPHMVYAREKMLNGERVEACMQCYEEEALGGHSMRIGFNEKWGLQEKKEILNRVKESREKNFWLTESMPFYYDLRQGNLCNLKCRSCAPENSISIEKEYIKISNNSPWFSENIGKPNLTESYRSWFNNAEFYQQLLEQMPKIKKFYFTGGEPTLIEKNYELLQYCVDHGYASNIELMFNTNLTNVSDRFINLIKKFKYVMLNLSIEGFGIEQEYLRGNSKWPVIDAALNKLAQNHSKNLHFLLTPVMQACNVLTIDKLFYYIESLNEKYDKNLFYFMPIILNEPAYLDMAILPQKTRLLAAEKLQAYLIKSKITGYDAFFETRLKQLISKLHTPSDEPVALVHKFIHFTQVLDGERRQDFKSAFPELFNSWKENSPNFKWDEFKIVEHDAFCVTPFVHMNTTTGGLYKYCCIMDQPAKKDSGEALTIYENTLQDAWNSNEIKALRKDMLTGAKPVACKKCHYEESHGQHSLRKDYNNRWLRENTALVLDRITQSIEMDGALLEQPVFIELKFGNLCNLKCRMCSPFDSSKVEAEYSEISSENEGFDKLWAHRENVLFNSKIKKSDLPAWHESEPTLDQFYQLLPTLKKLHFAGGEPTLHKQFYDLIADAIKLDLAKNIELSFNTNLTSLSDSLLQMLPHFKSVSVHASIDGTEQIQEYIRFPSKWSVIEENLKRLSEAPSSVTVVVSPTLQVYNVFELPKLFKYLDDFNKTSAKFIAVTPTVLDNPDYLNVHILPLHIRQDAAGFWRKYAETVPPENWLRERTFAIASMIEDSSKLFDPKAINNFFLVTNAVDKKRKQSFSECYPQLYANLITHMEKNYVGQ